MDPRNDYSTTDTKRRYQLVLGLLLFAAFCPFLLAELFWDDNLVIRPDGPIASLSTLREVFSARCVLFDQTKYSYPYYRPLIDALFILEYALTGTRPFLYHLTNFLLHAANAQMVFLLLRNLTGSLPRRELAAFSGAALFAIHPIQCESVLWPAARPAVLSLFFFLLAAMALGRAWRSSGPRSGAFCALSIVAFIGALLSKEVAVALLPPALLLFATRGIQPPRAVIATAGLMMGVLAGYLLLNSAVGGSARELSRIGPSGLVVIAAKISGFYLWKLVWPFALIPSYASDAWDQTAYLMAGAMASTACVVLFLICLYSRTRQGVLAAAGITLFGGGAVLPILGGQVTVADRYVYQAMLGLGVTVAVAIGSAPNSWASLHTRRAGLILLVILAGLSLRQSSLWTSSRLMWTHTVEVDPVSLNGNMYLGRYREENGDLAGAAECYRIAAYSERSRASESRFDAALALGRVLFDLGRNEDALTALEFAAGSQRLAGDALVRRAIVEFARGNPEAARQLASTFVDSGNESSGVYLNLALLEWRMNHDRAAALGWYRRARAGGGAIQPELEALGEAAPNR